MKRLIVLMVAAILVLCMSGLATSAQLDIPPKNPNISSEPIVLKVWLAADYANEAPFVDLVKRFEETYPNIDVQVTGYEWEVLAANVKIAVTGGDPPDVAHQHAFAMGAQGYAEPLDDLWAAWGAEPLFLPGAMKDVEWKGIKYGVPLDVNCLMLFYNQEMFDAAGLAYPTNEWTLVDVLEAAKKLTNEKEGRFGLANSAGGWDVSGLAKANGANLVNIVDGKAKANLDDPRVIEVVKAVTEATWKDRIASVPPPQARQSDAPVWLFANEKAAMFISGPWDLGRLRNEFAVDFKFGTSRLPLGMRGTTIGSVQGGGSLFVPAGSKNREAAFEFMKWAVSDYNQMRMAKDMARFPVTRHLYEDEYFAQEPLLKPFLEMLPYASPYMLDPYPEAGKAWEDAIRAAFYGRDAETELKNAQKLAQSAIDRAEGQ